MRGKKTRPKVIVITSDDTPGTLLAAVREHAYHYLAKPIERDTLADAGAGIAGPESQCSADRGRFRPARNGWSCWFPARWRAATRLEAFMTHLEAGLSEEVRNSVAQAFHELLMNAIEWGGKLNPKRRVRISFLRAKRMLLYRIADPGPGFKFADLDHAAISHGGPIEHGLIREQRGLRPGGFGLVLVKAKVDELLYNEAQNEVVFVKYLD